MTDKQKTDIYTYMLKIARDNNQTVNIEEHTIGGEGDYFITLEQLQDYLINL